jgi:hypothetical protein
MKKYVLFAFIALFSISSHSAWAQYVKHIAEDGTVSWIGIYGEIEGTKIKIRGGGEDNAFCCANSNDGNYIGRGSIDLNEVWSESGGIGIHYQVTIIGESSFVNCHGLTSVVIPSSVTSIEYLAFSDCSDLTSIDIPFSVTSIGNRAFSWCSGLTSVTIPNSVTSIGAGAFAGCSSLTSIVVESDNSVYDSRNNCNAIIETASNTLIAGCSNTNIPSSVTNIGDRAFEGCSGLTSIEIPSSVTSIGNFSFSGCSGMTLITSYITEVFNTGTDAFNGCNKATLYVPKGLVITYRSTADWNRINWIEEMSEIISGVFISCNNKGKVIINGDVQFTNDLGEVNVKDGEDNIFVFQPNDNCQLKQVLIDGLDVTLSVENNQLTTKVNEGSKMIVIFDKAGYDVNGDGQININDVVTLVNYILGK